MSELSGLVIRSAEAEDLEPVLTLLRLALGPGSAPRTAEFWRWKHQLNPFGPSPAIVALAEGQLVGLRVFLRWRWRLGDRTLEAVRPVDTAVHPDWRRRGLFSHLTRSLVDRVTADGCELLFNTPNRQSGSGYRKLGWRPAGRPPLLVRPRRPLRMAAAALGAGRRRVAAELGHYPAAAELLDRPATAEILHDQSAERAGRLSTASDPGFLRWRYVDIPSLDYRALWSADASSAVAIVFRSRLRRGMREILVAEVLSRGSVEGRGSLLRELMDRLAGENEVDYLLAGAPKSSPDGVALRRAGFRPIPWGPTLMTRCLVDEPELSTRAVGDFWQLSAGDLEIF